MDKKYLLVPGQPKPKQRPRVSKGRIYSPSGRDEKRIKDHLRPQVDYYNPIESDVILKMVFYRGDRRRVDLDNMVKLVTDAMNGLVYVDDNQIIEMTARKDYDKENSRTEVEIWEA